MICVTWSIHPTPPVAKKIPAYPLNPQDPVASGPEAQEGSRRRRCQYVTSATSAKDVKDVRKLLVLGCFLAVFPKRQKELASLPYPRASVLYGGHCHCPWMQDAQVLQSLLIPQVAISPMVCNWSQDSACGI